MHAATRKLFPYLALCGLLAATAWAVSFGTLPEADFTFVNGTEVESLDPARVSGAPEGRIINALFEGLYRPHPETLEPRPAMATSADLSEIMSPDRRTFTFKIREDAQWSDGTPVTADDFRWSWQRLLHPETASQYHFVLSYYVVNADKYQDPMKLAVNDPVEVELADRKVPHQAYPQGTILQGKFLKVSKPPKPESGPDEDPEEKEQKTAEWIAKWIYEIKIDGKPRRFSKESEEDGVERCQWVLFDFDKVGIETPDSHTLVVRLKSATPFFLYLMQFYPTFPVNRHCVEKFGYPGWTNQQNIVVNGPFLLEFRRVRDRIRLKKNPDYWNAEKVRLNLIDAIAVESSTTGLNMYLNGEIDWAVSPPSSVIPELEKRDDYIANATLTIYFYRVNVTRPPLDNVLVRRALNMAINKEEIASVLLKAGQKPARSMVPPGLTGYELAQCGSYDVEKARKLLAETGYPNGQGLPPIEILYNTNQGHQEIAETIGEYWQRDLGVKVRYRNLEWASYLQTVDKLQFDISRAGWIGDYPDPNTFLDLFISEGAQNQTGWKNKEYDALIGQANMEEDAERRLIILHEAEQILMDELPIIPIYSYVNVNLVKPYVRGFYPNAQDLHPLTDIWIDEEARSRYRREKAGR